MKTSLVAGVDVRPLRALRTGVETFLAQVIRLLPGCGGPLSLRLLSDGPVASEWTGDGGAIHTVPARTRLPRVLGDAWILRDLPRALRARPVDVFFTASTKFPPGGTPSVVTVHDLGWRRMPAAYEMGERIRQFLWTRWAAHRATRLVAVSEFTRRDLVAWVPSCASRVRVVPEGVHARWQPAEDRGLAAAMCLPLGVDGPFVLSVGTLSPKKNLAALLEAFRRIREHRPEYRLVLAGKPGWKTGTILTMAQETAGVVVTGHVSDETLAALYGAADVVVVPSRCEGFGLPVLEAMASGTPVVAARAGALPEVAGEAALLCEPTPRGLAEAIEALLGDHDLARELRGRGLRRAAEFTWERTAASVADVLREAAAAV